MEMSAENLVNVYEQTIKGMKSKLDTMTWKLDEYEKKVINTMKNMPTTFSVSVGDLLQDLTNVRNDYETLRTEMMSVEEQQKEMKSNLTEEIHCVISEYYALRALLKNSKPE